MRIRRSMLLVPSNVERMMAKAHDIDVDVVTLDLQDGIPNRDDAKRAARQAAVEAISKGGFKAREISVRVNGPRTEWFLEDVAEVVRAGADSIKLTHARGLADVLFADGYLRAVSKGRKVEIILCPEFPETVLAMEDIARHAKLVTAMQVSPGDFSLEMRASPELAKKVGLDEDDPLVGVRYQLLLVARAAGWNAIDSRRRGTDPKNLESVRLSMLQSRALGFDGCNILHPTHIPVANQVYGPSEEELAWANKVIAAFESIDPSRAVARTDDAELIAPPTYLKACQVRDYSEAIRNGHSEFDFKSLP